MNICATSRGYDEISPTIFRGKPFGGLAVTTSSSRTFSVMSGDDSRLKVSSRLSCNLFEYRVDHSAVVRTRVVRGGDVESPLGVPHRRDRNLVRNAGSLIRMYMHPVAAVDPADLLHRRMKRRIGEHRPGPIRILGQQVFSHQLGGQDLLLQQGAADLAGGAGVETAAL